MILVAALAVPGFLFYTWWTHLNDQSRKQLSMKVRNRLPPGTTIFGQASPAQDKLSNPIGNRAQLLAASLSPVVASSAAVAEAAPVSTASLTSAWPQLPEPPQDQQQRGVIEVGSIAQIVLARDPMLSPYDTLRIQEAELRIRQAEQQLEAERSRRRRPVVRREKPIDLALELQGIVSTAEGDKAIVNGEVVGEGDFVAGVKVVKITPNGVVFLHRNKRFIRGISK